MARPIIVSLSPDEYRRLAQCAEASDRDVHQEARHIVRRFVADCSQHSPAGGAGWSAPASAAGPRKECPSD